MPRKTPVPGVTASVELMDPIWAAKLLQTNPSHQRNISSSNLRKIEASLRNEEFVLNGQPVITDEHGKLLDGQHRLQGCVNTGVSFWTVIVRGIPAEYFKFMDCGKSRTFSDVLKTMGHVSTSRLSSSVQRLAEYLRNPRSVGSGITFAHSELIDVAEMTPGLADAIRAVHACRHIISESQIAWLYYLAHSHDSEQCDQFIEYLASGHGLTPTHPIFHFRLRIFNDRKEGFHPSMREMQALLIKTWNGYVQNKVVKNLRVYPGEEFPELLLPTKAK